MPLPSITVSGQRTEATAGFNIGTPIALAATGSAIGNAAPIVGRFTIVSAADNAVGVQLPAISTLGDAYFVYSSVSANGLKVYPQANSSINYGSANAAYVMEGQTMHMFVAGNATNWLQMGLTNA